MKFAILLVAFIALLAIANALPGEKSDPKGGAKSDGKAGGKSDTKDDPKGGAKSDGKSGVKSDPKPHRRSSYYYK